MFVYIYIGENSKCFGIDHFRSKCSIVIEAVMDKRNVNVEEWAVETKML